MEGQAHASNDLQSWHKIYAHVLILNIDRFRQSQSIVKCFIWKKSIDIKPFKTQKILSGTINYNKWL